MKAERKKQQVQAAGSQTPRRRRRFTQEFKLEAVRLATGGDRSIPEVAHDLGIGANSLPDSAFGSLARFTKVCSRVNSLWQKRTWRSIRGPVPTGHLQPAHPWFRTWRSS